MTEMKWRDLPKSRPEIWRLAIYLHSKFSKASDWPVADKHGWYKAALEIHNEVYRYASPYLTHEIPMEAWTISFEPDAPAPRHGDRSGG